MKDSLILGMALGFVVGAVLVQSNKKAEKIVEMGKEKIKEEINKI